MDNGGPLVKLTVGHSPVTRLDSPALPIGIYLLRYDRTTLYGLLIELAVHNDNYYVVPRALSILEAQACLVKFLHDFVISILVDTNIASTKDSTSELARIDVSAPIPPPLLKDSSKMRFAMSYYNVCMSARQRLLRLRPQLP